MQAFIVSLIAGSGFPLLPLIAEWGVTGSVRLETWAITAVVYIAAVGLISRHQAIMISALFLAAVIAIIYGAQLVIPSGKSAPMISHIPAISGALIALFMLFYSMERFVRHFIENQPFLEIDL